MKKLIILDRDGVINYDSDEYIKTVDEWQPIPGSIEAIAKLSKAGYKVAIATNQSGLARGYFDQTTLNAMHHKMTSLVEHAGGQIDGIFFCPHHPEEGCNCRKPQAGLVNQIAESFGRDVSGCYLIGDNASDMELATSVGCTPILVKTGKGKRILSKGFATNGIAVFDDLAAAVEFIVN